MSNSQLKKTIYSPDSYLRNPGLLVREMLADLTASRGLAWRLFVRNISAQYRQSILGYIWAFLPPLLSMAVWVFLNSQKVIKIEDPGMPYPLFVLTGTVLWQTFVDALNSPLSIVNQSKSMLAKINFPREALIITGFLQVGFNLLIRVVLIVAIFAWYQTPVAGSIMLALSGVLILIILGIALGLLLTPLGVLYTDVGRSISIVTQFWFFLTPIIYPMPTDGFMVLINRFNPVSPVLVSVREWLALGSASQLTGFWTVGCIALVLLLLSWILFRVAMPHLIVRISA
jgi:lipopolysaccharide transport system permease protein